MRSGVPWRVSQSVAPLTTVPVEPPNRKASGQAVAGPDRVGLLYADDVVHAGRVEQRRRHTGAEARDHPAAGCPAEGDRAHAVHRHDPHPAPPFPEPVRAAHQRPGGADPHEQHVQARELPGDGGRGGAVVRPPVGLVGVLVEPHVPLVGGAQRAYVRDPGAQETAGRVRLGDDVHPAAEGLDEPSGLRIDAGVGHTQKPIAPARRDHAQRDAQIAGRGLDEGRARPEPSVLRDTARSRAMASFTADSEVPPRSKKWS